MLIIFFGDFYPVV